MLFRSIHPLVEAQARDRVRATVFVPSGSFTTGSMESSSSGMLNSVWRREARLAQERLNQRPTVEEQGTQQQNPVAAEGGVVPDVGGTPVPAAPPRARATSLTRQFKGVAEGWWYNVKSSMTPRAQVPNTDPGRTVEAKAEPCLGGTPAPAMPSSRTDSRSLLNPRFRTNLQALNGSRRMEDPSPLGT